MTPPPRVMPKVDQNVRRPGSNPPPKVDEVNDAAQDASKPYRPGKYKEPVSQFYVVIGMACAPLAPRTGMAFVENADSVAEEWDKLARTNPKVKRALDRFVTGGGWGGLLLAHGAIGMVAVQETGLLSKVPFLKRFFPTLPDPEPPAADDFGNPLPPNGFPSPVAPFERRGA